jgi:hypothetical protein
MPEVEPEKPNYEEHPEETPVMFGAKSLSWGKKGKVLRVIDLTTAELEKGIRYASEKPQYAEWARLATLAYEARKKEYVFPNKPIKEAV